jgi:hypothetical protein
LDALGTALREILTADYLRSQSLSIVDQVFDYLEGRDQEFEIALDISPIKTALAGEARLPFAESLAAALPACDRDQQPIADGGRLTRCIAGDSSVDAAAEQIAAALPAVLADKADKLVLNDDTIHIRMNWYDFDWFLGSNVVAAIDIAIVMTIFTALTAGFVGAFLGADDPRGLLRWLSAALFVPASLFLLLGLVLASPLIAGPISRGLALARWSVAYSESFRVALSDVVVPAVQQVGNGFLLSGIVGCLIALLLLIVSQAAPASNAKRSRMVQVPARNS